MITIYGIPNCDTIKKTKKLFEAEGAAFAFHDYKKQGIPADIIEKAMDTAGWDVVLNRKGTTWRKLDEATKASVTNAQKALALLLENASMIKRPIVVAGDQITVGFDETVLKEMANA